MGQALAMKTTSHSWQYGKEMVAPSCHIKFLWLLSCESKWIDDIDAVWNQGFRLWGGFNIRLWTLGYTVYHGIPLKDPYMISYHHFNRDRKSQQPKKRHWSSTIAVCFYSAFPESSDSVGRWPLVRCRCSQAMILELPERLKSVEAALTGFFHGSKQTQKAILGSS